jgi:protein-S-isoprenylcysteine O-methyltransferase Ste14
MANESTNVIENPGTKIPPPVFLLVAIFVGYWMQRVVALNLPDWGGWSVVGGTVVGAGCAILIGGWVQFYRAKTNILHQKPSSHVIQSGLYRFSRNPIYVSALLLQVGIGVLMANLWVVLFVPVSKVMLDRFVIAGEEAYLEYAFGEVYAEYKRGVRRWV